MDVDWLELLGDAATGGGNTHSRLASHRDDDFSSGVSFFKIPESFGDLAQRVASIDNRYYFARFEKLLQKKQILLVHPRHHEPHFLAGH